MKFHYLPLRAVLILQLLFTPSYGVEQSLDDWRHYLKEQMGLVQSLHFVLLSQDYSNLGLGIAWKTQERLSRLTLLENQLLQLDNKLQGLAVLDMKALREFALVHKQIELLAEHTKLDKEVFDRSTTAWRRQCEKNLLEKHTVDYDVASLVPIQKTLTSMNESIDKIAEMGLENFSIYVSYGTTGAYIGSQAQASTSSRWEDAVIGISSAIGASIGSMGFGIGTTLGAILGFIAGLIIVFFLTVFFVKSPEAQAIEAIREQVEFVITAINELRGAPSQKLLQDHCDRVFKTPENNEFLNKLEMWVNGQNQKTKEIAKNANSLKKALEARYEIALSDLVADYFEVFQKNFDKDFDAYLADRVRRSAESKKFFQIQLTPDLLKLQKGGLDLGTRHSLETSTWSSLIRGEAKFSQAKSAFPFSPSSVVQEEDLIYWTAARNQALKILRGASAQ